MDDLVSIITPLYNSEEFIEETINSVLNQTYKNWEMLIVDDCSIDNSLRIVKQFAADDSRIKLIQLETNSGAAIARNKAIEEAQGRYIAFLDSDDLWHSQKLEKQIEFMQENNYAFTFTKYQQMTEDGNLIDRFIEVPDEITYEKALYTNPVGCLTVIYDVKKLGKLYMPLIRKRQDYGLWLKILKKIECGYGLNENLAYYRVRNNSVSSNKLNLIKYQWELYREVEKLSLVKSVFYLSSVILSKMLNIK